MKSAQELTRNEKIVLNTIQGMPNGATYKDIESAGVPKGSVINAISKLAEKGFKTEKNIVNGYVAWSLCNPENSTKELCSFEHKSGAFKITILLEAV